MNSKEYHDLNEFPQVFKSLCDYSCRKVILKPGDLFIGIKKEILIGGELAIIDSFGCRHDSENMELVTGRLNKNKNKNWFQKLFKL